LKKEKKRIKKVLAYLLILLGISVITFPFLRRSVRAYKIEKEYEAFANKKQEQKDIELEKKAEDYNEKIKSSTVAMVDPFEEQNFENETILENPDEIFAYIRIPKLDKYLPIYLDASLYHISMGVAQISGTDIPIGGRGRRSVIAGHRGRRGDNMFLYIDDLVEGDSIFIERNQKSMEYKVYSKEVIGPYDRDALKPVGDEDIVTLLTCSPFLPPRPNRLLVNAKRVEEVKEETKAESTKEDKEEKNQAPSKKSKYIKIITYLMAAIGSIAFVWVLIKFIKYLVK
jgi:sortase A